MIEASPRQRKIVASVIGTTSLIAAIVLAIMYWPTRIPPVDANARELVAFIASNRFNTLPEDRKEAYLRSVRPHALELAVDQTISEETKTQALQNAMAVSNPMTRQMTQYFQLPPGKARDAFLDKLIAQSAATRPAQARSGAAAGARPGGGGRFMTPERQKAMVEAMPPTQRAQMAEFMAAMRARRQAAGK